MKLTVSGWVPILGSAARNIDRRIFIDTIPRLLYTKPTSKSQINNSYDYEAFISVIILNNVSVCRFKTWYKVEDMTSKFIVGSAGDSILMNNSMQETFDLTDIFLHTPCEKINRKSNLCIEKTTCSIIIKGGKGLNTNDEKIQWHPHLMRYCRSNSETKQNIWNLIRNISSQKSQCRSMCWSKMKTT